MVTERDTEKGILVTGASGFLAGDLLPRLLNSYREAPIYLLLRAEGEADLAERRAKILARAGLDNAAAERVIALSGDIEREDLGFGEQYDRLAGKIGEIYHSAANTSFSQSLETARRINFAGGEHIVRFARQIQRLGHFTRLHHVSTAYVSGNRLGLIKEEELDCGQGFFNTYEQSKFESEVSLRRAAAELPITVYRPSVIVGDSRTGRSAHFYVIYEPMKWVYAGQLTFLPCRPELKLDIVPVDYVCDAMVAIGRRHDTVNETYHLTAGPDLSINLRELVDGCLKEFNIYNREIGKPPVAMPEIVTPEMIAQFEGDAEAKANSEIFFQRAWQQMQRHVPYIVSEKIFDDSKTRAVLAGSEVRCPSLNEYLPAVVRYGLEREFKAS